jgi:hypothetical protein
VSATAFGISLATNVALLVGLIVLFLFGHGILSPGGASGPTTPGTALGSPTATSSPAASPTPRSGWLRVAPSSVQLSCADGQRNQFVVLQNTGPASVRWQAVFNVPAEQAGVTVDPQQGKLAAGASMSLQLQNTTQANGSQGGSSQQGVIDLTPTTPDAGSPASIAYTTVGCD